MFFGRCGTYAVLTLGLVCLGLFGIACSDADSNLDFPGSEYSSGEDFASSSSSSVGKIVPRVVSDSVKGEPVDTAFFIAQDLGACDELRSGEISQTTFCGVTCYAICDSLAWRYATMEERDVYGFPKDTVEGTVLDGRLLSLNNAYVFENGSWRSLSFIEMAIGYCDSSLYGKIDSVRGSYYHCVSSGGEKSMWADLSPVLVDYMLLPESAAEEDIVYGTRSDRYFLYRKGAWRMATVEEVVGRCHRGREGDLVKFPKGYFVCKEGTWEPALRDDVLGACALDSEGVSANIGHIAFTCRSGRWIPENLHSHTTDSVFYWDAFTDNDGRVEFELATKTSGYFFEFTDAIYEGLSILRYPTQVRRNKSRIYTGPLIAENRELFATADFGTGLARPFAGLGFNLWNGDVWSDSSEGVDIRKWEGLCFIYESEAPLTIAIAPEGGVILEGGNFYKMRLPAAKQSYWIEIPYELFEEDEDWGGSESQDLVLSSAASILFYIEGVAKESKSFAIYVIGSLGQCEQWVRENEK